MVHWYVVETQQLCFLKQEELNNTIQKEKKKKNLVMKVGTKDIEKKENQNVTF